MESRGEASLVSDSWWDSMAGEKYICDAVEEEMWATNRYWGADHTWPWRGMGKREAEFIESRNTIILEQLI